MEQWACRLRSAFYDVEDILDVADYNRLENKQHPDASSLKSQLCHHDAAHFSIRDKERDDIVRMLRDTWGEPKSWIIWAMGLKNYGLRLVFTMLSLIWAKIGWAITGLGPRLDPARSEATGFSVDKIYQKMLEAATGKPSSEFSNLDTLQMKFGKERRIKPPPNTATLMDAEHKLLPRGTVVDELKLAKHNTEASTHLYE
uniref:Uncharacterized protein n=1 Tax=Oryza glumipatula TaxID=40148 RepID=A0A0D9ZGE7_9ORYZ